MTRIRKRVTYDDATDLGLHQAFAINSNPSGPRTYIHTTSLALCQSLHPTFFPPFSVPIDRCLGSASHPGAWHSTFYLTTVLSFPPPKGSDCFFLLVSPELNPTPANA